MPALGRGVASSQDGAVGTWGRPLGPARRGSAQRVSPALKLLPPQSSVLLPPGLFQILFIQVLTSRGHTGRDQEGALLGKCTEKAPASYPAPPRRPPPAHVTRHEARGPVMPHRASTAERLSQPAMPTAPAAARACAGRDQDARGRRLRAWGPAEGWCRPCRNATCWWALAWAASSLISRRPAAGVLRPLWLAGWGVDWAGRSACFLLYISLFQKNFPHPLQSSSVP